MENSFLQDYTLLDELGKGGYATVYKVRHNQLGYTRAVRVLNATIAKGEDDKTYQKFLDECRLLLRLGNGCHPNIVHIYQPLLRMQKALVEMDYVNGLDLTHFLEDNNGFVEAADVLRLVEEIGSALAYCHEDIYKYCMDKEEDNLLDDPDDGSKVLLDDQTRERLINKYRVIHNDIHSGNIMRNCDGRYVLLDFGLSIEGDDVIRSSRRHNGAPEFKAPEKWDSDLELSAFSDVYSFGVVLYEMLAGRVPFPYKKGCKNTAEAEYLLSKAHKEDAPEPVYELRKKAFENKYPGQEYKKDYPDWLEELIMICLEKNPTDRFRSGRALYDFYLENSASSSAVVSHTDKDSEAEIASLKEKLSIAESKIVELKNLVSTLYNQTLEPETPAKPDVEHQLLRKENEKLQRKLQELEDATKGNYVEQVLKKENSALKQTIEELKKNVPDEQEIVALKQDNEELKNKVKSLETAISKSGKGEMDLLKFENKTLKAEVQSLAKRNLGTVVVSVLLLVATLCVCVLL